MKSSWISPIVIGFLACGFVTTVHSPAEAREEQAGHLVPVDKKLSQDAMQQLFERGRREVYSGEELDTIGMPIGGVAAGQLYLRGDGTLGLWQIFNKHIFSGYGLECYRTYKPDSPVDSGFAVIAEQDGKTFAKTLDRDFGVRLAVPLKVDGALGQNLNEMESYTA